MAQVLDIDEIDADFKSWLHAAAWPITYTPSRREMENMDMSPEDYERLFKSRKTELATFIDLESDR